MKMEYKIYVWDFVKNEGKLVYTTDDLKEAKNHAYIEAIQYCEDEKPRIYRNENIIEYMTGCDFGSIIKIGE